MKKLFAVLCIMLLSGSFASYANVVSEADALQKASAFLRSSQSASRKSNGRRSNLKLRVKGKALKTGNPSYYLFARDGEEGFVLVAGDDRVANPILGYSLSGSVDSTDIPENMKVWLDGYAEQIEYMTEQKEEVRKVEPQTGIGKAVVAPLLKTKWDQLKPFNDKCPMGWDGRAPVGCVAVALGQIMNYHRWPAKSEGIIDYDAGLTWINEDLADYSYDFDNLDIPQFLYNVAAACQVKFENDGSGAWDVIAGKGILEHFDYDKGMEYHVPDYKAYETMYPSNYVYKSCSYTKSQWDSLLRVELDERRPVYYSGSNLKTGHAFVCDGYDDSGYFHFNWGWGGAFDGWFVTSALSPGGSWFSSNQAIITHIQPNRGNAYWVDSHITGEFSSHFLNTLVDTVKSAYCVENCATGEKRYLGVRDNVKAKENKKRTYINVSYSEKTLLKEEGGDLPNGTYKGYYVYQSSDGVWNTFRVCESEKETFQWIDVENGKCVLSSSRSFDYVFHNKRCSCFILDDDKSVRFSVGYIDENETTLRYPEEVEYRGKKYIVREIVQEVREAISGDLSQKKVVFPKTLRKLYAIGEFHHLDLPDSLEYLSLRYFKGKTLKLPSSLLHIGRISDCPNLESLEIPEGVKSIGNIERTEKWRSLVVPSSVTSIGECRQSSFKSIVFKPGSQVKELPEKFANQSKQLKEVVLPDHLLKVGKYAFGGCNNITSITLPSSVKDISYAFGCNSLRVVNVAKDSQLENITDAFSGCVSLEHFEIPSSVKTIGWDAFYGCRSLTSIVIPNSVTSIEDEAFSHCRSLTSIVIPNSVTSIGESAFSGCVALRSIELPSSLESFGDHMFYKCESLESVRIPDIVTIIDEYAFKGCYNLREVTLGKSVKEVESYSFGDCTRLSRIYCYAQIPPIFVNVSIIRGRATLYVPRESLELYKQAYSTGSFADICPINYYLSYYVDGKLYNRELLDIGTHITPLAEPEKVGHTFSGWEDPIPDVMPTYDVAVGGHFTVNTYKVTYMVGNEVVHVDNVAYGSPIPAYVYSPEDEAVVFRGWIGERYEKMPAFDVVYIADIANGIDDIVQDKEMDVYDLTGMKVGTTSEWHTLKPGTYIVNGRKVRKR